MGKMNRLNIGPKGLRVKNTAGATYWDTEAYAIPLYLAWQIKKFSKNLLNSDTTNMPPSWAQALKQGLKGGAISNGEFYWP